MSTMSTRDHPRTCGEKFQHFVWGKVQNGSPPHMRGKATSRNSLTVAIRITPAHAGKSCRGAGERRREQDHPRTCGEKDGVKFSYFTVPGSPPHMRGKEQTEETSENKSGITPAHAGKSFNDFFAVFIVWDHPRTCGEKILTKKELDYCKGSPPHMRGKVKVGFSHIF